MKNYLFVLALLIGYCVCNKHGDGIQKGVRRMHNDEEARQSKGTVSDGDSISYPCSVRDLKCIRKYFATHGRCRPQNCSVPETVLFPQLTVVPMATSNISFIIKNAKIAGLNGNITSFYINKKTENLVIAFESKPLTILTSEITFIYNRKGKEPIRLTDFFSITYASVTFTAVIPKIKDLQLAHADVYAYLDDGSPKYKFGPGVSNSSDIIVSKAYCDFISKLAANNKEGLVIVALNFMKVFIENKICDFGLHTIN